MLNIFSCACWPSGCHLWRNVYLGLLPIFWLGCLLSFWYWTVWAVCVFWKLIPCQLHYLQIFSLTSVMPDVRIPQREKRRPPWQCNTQRKGNLLLTQSGPLLQPTQWCKVREPWAPVSTHIYRVLYFKHKQWVVITSRLFMFTKQFHWSNTL